MKITYEFRLKTFFLWKKAQTAINTLNNTYEIREGCGKIVVRFYEKPAHINKGKGKDNKGKGKSFAGVIKGSFVGVIKGSFGFFIREGRC